MEMNNIFNWKILLEILENNSLGEELHTQSTMLENEIMIITDYDDEELLVKTHYISSNAPYYYNSPNHNIIIIPTYNNEILKDNIYMACTEASCENMQFISNVKYKKDGEEAEKIYRALVAKIRNYCEKNNLI